MKNKEKLTIFLLYGKNDCFYYDGMKKQRKANSIAIGWNN